MGPPYTKGNAFQVFAGLPLTLPCTAASSLRSGVDSGRARGPTPGRSCARGRWLYGKQNTLSILNMSSVEPKFDFTLHTCDGVTMFQTLRTHFKRKSNLYGLNILLMPGIYPLPATGNGCIIFDDIHLYGRGEATVQCIGGIENHATFHDVKFEFQKRGLYITCGSHPRFESCIFDGSHIARDHSDTVTASGLVKVAGSSRPKFSNCVFTGGDCFGVITSYDASCFLKNCTVTQCDNAGLMLITEDYGGSIKLKNCFVHDNYRGARMPRFAGIQVCDKPTNEPIYAMINAR